MQNVCENEYETAVSPSNQSDNEQPKLDLRSASMRSYVDLLLKMTAILIMSLVVIFLAMIALHFHHQGEDLQADMKKLEQKLAESLNADNKTVESLKNQMWDLRHEMKADLSSQKNFSTRQASEIKDIKNFTRELPYLMLFGSRLNPASSCAEIKGNRMTATDGLYYLKDMEGTIFRTYCAMDTAGGGWTLVASIHENNMKGRCTTGDRWSSEQGNSDAHPHGDGFWENRATYGRAASATSDDFKNSGYFAMNSSDIMIWVVPNDTPMEQYLNKAFLKFHTTSAFLQSYGGNLKTLYADHFPMKARQFRMNSDNGPSFPIVWDTGSNEELLQLLPSGVKQETDPGFMQFRVINDHRNAFALCPGLRVKPGKWNVEHSCIGSTSGNTGSTLEGDYCGDFAARDWPHNAGWASDQNLIASVVMIFYK